MPLSIELLSAHAGFKGISVERGIGSAKPGTDAAYIAMCRFLFDKARRYKLLFVRLAWVQVLLPLLY